MRGKRPVSKSLRSHDTGFVDPVLGIDEVGTGAIAGPVYACGVVLPRGDTFLSTLESLNLKDSKQMSEASRTRVYDFLLDDPAVRYCIVKRSAEELVEFGYFRAIAMLFNDILAWYRTEFRGSDASVLIDGNRNPHVKASHVHWITQGDNKSLAIAAASVLAKVSRDRHMVELAKTYPEYGFEIHKGYLTSAHAEALEKLGPCDLHRKNTAPIRKLLERGPPG